MIIAIDFDGVIVTDEYPNIGTPMLFVHDIMCMLADRGHILIINTCRTGNHALEAIEALRAMNLPFCFFNENHPRQAEKYGQESRKISADLYLDDKNIGGFPGWLAVRDKVLRHDSR